MATASDLPPELLLMIFPHLPLPALLASLGVCRAWRHLAPLSALPPTRRKLLSLYRSLLTSPAFIATRPLVGAHLVPFDRERYVRGLPEGTPEELTMFVREWPERAAVPSLWPGLSGAFFETCRERGVGEVLFAPPRSCPERNALAEPPKVRVVELEIPPPPTTSGSSVVSGATHTSTSTSGPAHVPALPIHDEANGWVHWLVLSTPSVPPTLAGAVYSKVRAEVDVGAGGAIVNGGAGAGGGGAVVGEGYAETKLADGWLAYVAAEVAGEQACLEMAGLWCPCRACEGRVGELVL